MTTDTKILVVQALISRFGFSRENAEDAYRRLSFDPHILRDFITWLEIGELPIIQHGQVNEYSVNGYTVSQFVNQHQHNPLAAFLRLAWFARDPQAAESNLKEGIGKRDQVIMDGSVEEIIRKRAARRSSQS